jgi:hypothetical protein
MSRGQNRLRAYLVATVPRLLLQRALRVFGLALDVVAALQTA